VEKAELEEEVETEEEKIGELFDGVTCSTGC